MNKFTIMIVEILIDIIKKPKNKNILIKKNKKIKKHFLSRIK